MRQSIMMPRIAIGPASSQAAAEGAGQVVCLLPNACLAAGTPRHRGPGRPGKGSSAAPDRKNPRKRR